MTWLPVVLPVAAGPLLWIWGAARARHGAPRSVLRFRLGVSALVIMAATLASTVPAGAATLRWGPALSLHLSAEGFAAVASALVPAVAAPVVAYAAASSEDTVALPRLVGLLTVFVGVMELLVLAADLLTLLMAWELVAAVSWALIGFRWRDGDNLGLAAHAFNVTRFGGLGLFLAAGAAFGSAGSFDYTAIAGLRRGPLDVVAAGVLVAAAAKSAQLPFSPWLFSAMAGPTPVSALLHSATMVAAGAYAIVRLQPSLSATGWFGPATVVVGLATAVAGGAVALMQTDGKRVLAASTSAQYGLMFTAAGAGSAAAAAAHLVTHAFFKSLLFLGVGVAMHAASTADIRRMRLGRALPGVAASFAVGVLALAAVPPLGGAWSKEEIVAAAVAAGPVTGWVTMLAGFLSAAYAGRLYLLAFGRRPGPPHNPQVHRPHPVEAASMALLAAASVLLGLLWLPGSAQAVRALTGLDLVEADAWGAVASLLAAAAGVAVALAAARGGRAATMGLPAGVTEAVRDWFALPAATKRVIVDPVLRLAAMLSRFDERGLDAGVRGIAAAASGASRFLSWWAERGIDGVVRAAAGGAGVGSLLSRVADDRGVDVAVEGVATGVGRAGRRSRRLQSGLAHHYYVVVASGVVAIVATLALWR